jgi:hypothetical protein
MALPSTPLKDTERRGDAWRAAWGIEQTEIDALASLRPDLLRSIARAALAPFYDWTLDARVKEAKSAWLGEAARVAVDQLGADRLAAIREQATAQLAAIREQVDAVREAMQIDVGDLELPEPVVPEPDMDGRVYPLPLLDSGWSFAEGCRRLIASKAYRNGDGS